MRKRKHPERAIITYRYWARPDVLPEAMWSIARRMQALWNDLVVGREAFARAVAECDTERALIWKEWIHRVRALSDASGLNWECAPAIVDRFRSACAAAVKGQRGWPRVQHRLNQVMIPHRWTAGGVPVRALFSDRASRLRFEAADRRYTAGRFGLDHGESIRFHAVIHRPLPVDATVKRAAWVGKRHPIRGWQWALTITLEQTRLPAVTRPSELVAGLDVGWRAYEDYLRIGMLVDSAGRIVELRLPLDGSTRHTRRHKIEHGWLDVADLRSREGKAVEACKDQLRLIAPERVTALPGFSLMRQGGLVRSLRMLEQIPNRSSDDDTVMRVLWAWLDYNDRLRSRRMALSDRLIHRRQWWYRHLAKWLCSTYSVIAWEDDLNLKVMAEAEALPPALHSSMRYRQIVALHELRSYLSQAAAKLGTTLLGRSAMTTRTCWRCGATLDSTADLQHVRQRCPAGHEWDQDINAARNLLSQIPPALASSGVLRTGVGSNGLDHRQIPEVLGAVAVDVQEG